MFDAIAPRYDMVNRIMTFRLDVRWRRNAVKSLHLPAGSTVLDLAARHGRPLHRPRSRPALRPLSFDLSFGMLAADRSGSAADAGRHPPSAACPTVSVDGVTCGFALRNLVDLPAFFAELARVVRPGGRIALLDVGVPAQPGRPVRQQHLLRQGRAQDRRAAQRRCRLPVPAQERGLPAATRAAGADACATPGSPTPCTTSCRAASPS